MYCMTFDFNLAGAFDDENGDGSLEIDEKCTATLGDEDCVCQINVDVDNPELNCLQVDCAMVSDDWPPIQEGKCSSLEMDGNGSLEARSFLLAFDDTDVAKTDGNSDPADNSNTSENGNPSDANEATNEGATSDASSSSVCSRWS